ncbi:MAG: dienelactone hydrolase family protein [Gammaproteobacteria bacterium]|nr:dienelactone hydrolase family protein [Gammaproteobacteria bacterium]
MKNDKLQSSTLTIQAGDVALEGDLIVPGGAGGIVVFAHGSGSSRHSARNRFVARVLNEAGLATLLFDLLTPEEETIDEETRELRFDIPLLARRLIATLDWLKRDVRTAELGIGVFGASTGAAAALIAAAHRPEIVQAVVSRGGRPDLAADDLQDVRAPTLLIIGGEDDVVIELNRRAARRLTAPHHTEIVPGATHLFEERGTLERVAELASGWFTGHLRVSATR